jgi:hypothetical protein
MLRRPGPPLFALLRQQRVLPPAERRTSATDMPNSPRTSGLSREWVVVAGWVTRLFGSRVFDHRGKPDEVLKRVAESERLGRENSLPFLTEVMVPIFSGITLIRRGQLAEGTTSLATGLGFWEQAGGKCYSPYVKSILASGMAQLGDFAAVLHPIQAMPGSCATRAALARPAICSHPIMTGSPKASRRRT